MPKSEQPLLAGVKAELGGLADELREMTELRWRLVRLELQSDLRAVRGVLVAAGAAGVLVLASLPVLVVAAADALDEVWGISRIGWMLIFAVILLIGGGVLGSLAWRQFRKLTPLQQTREELREDAVWLKEWLGKEGEGQ